MSFCATSCTLIFSPLNLKAEVRAATRSSGIFASRLINSSDNPSAKYSLPASPLMFTNGSTAMDLAAACTGDPVDITDTAAASVVFRSLSARAPPLPAGDGYDGRDAGDGRHEPRPVSPIKSRSDAVSERGGDRLGDLVAGNGFRDVLDVARTEESEARAQLVLDLLVHRPGNENPTRLGQRLQPCRDIDAVAEQRAVLLDHIAEIHPDTQPHAPLGGQGVVLLGDRVLEVPRTAHRINGARKLRHQAVTDAAEFLPVELFDESIKDRATDLEGAERALLVGLHQPAVLDYIRRQDGSNFSAVLHRGTRPPFPAEYRRAAARNVFNGGLGYLDVNDWQLRIQERRVESRLPMPARTAATTWTCPPARASQATVCPI